MSGATTRSDALGGRTALVTGAGRGIGAAIAAELAAAGAHVVVNDLDGDAASSCAKAIVESGGSASVAPADVADPETAERVVTEADPDVLVNNAGVGHDPEPVEQLALEAIERRWAVDLRAPLLCARAAAVTMRRRGGGRIVMIGSRSWLGASGQADYSALKAGVVGLTRALAIELGPGAITVNAVVPGTISTPALDALPAATRAALLDRHPAGRFGSPHDVARAVLMFAAPDASVLTGQVLHVCGGRSVYGGPLDGAAAQRSPVPTSMQRGDE